MEIEQIESIKMEFELNLYDGEGIACIWRIVVVGSQLREMEMGRSDAVVDGSGLILGLPLFLCRSTRDT